MLLFTEVFRPQRLKEEKYTRCRVLGATYDEKFLILLNSTSQTSIEAVSRDGLSTTVISFKKYIDIVSAHLSHDHELIHITERIPSPKGFSFVSRIYHIFGNAKSNDITSDQPIDGFFLPICSPKGVYQLIHIIGNRLTHLKITIQKTSVVYEKLRGGLHIPNLLSYHYNFHESMLTAIYSNEKTVLLQIFRMNPQSIDSNDPIHINVMQKSHLPPELALNPLAQLHLPYFHNANNRFYVYSRGNKTCVIQQIFEGPESNLSFCVSAYPQTFNQFITAPNVRADIPICFARFESIIILFVPNLFLCIIDAALSPPSITVLPRILAYSVCSNCSSTLPMDNTIVDLDNSTFYQISIDFSKLVPFANLMDQSMWYAFALIIFRVGRSETLAELINLLVLKNDIDDAQSFFRTLLANYSMPSRFNKMPTRSKSLNIHQSLSQKVIGSMPPRLDRPPSTPIHPKPKMPSNIREIVEEIELEFPSSGKISRRHAFKKAVKALMDKKIRRSVETAATKALVFLRRQNEAALMIRDALDIWLKKFSPDEFWQMTIKFIIQNEAVFASFPYIPCLKEELGILGDTLCSKPIRKKFEAVGIMPPSEQPDEDSLYWQERLNLSRSSSSDSTTSTSSRVFHKKDNDSDDLAAFGSAKIDDPENILL